jgi:carbonic anhydrase
VSLREEALAANGAFVARVAASRGDDLDLRPSRRVAVVACMDARLPLEEALGLGPGEAHVIRNAGGRVTDDVARSLMLSSAVLGTREVAVVHHTRCGLHGVTNEALRARVAEVAGDVAIDTDFLPFGDDDEAVLEDVRAIERDPRLVFDELSGFVYDVDTGRIREVSPSR